MAVTEMNETMDGCKRLAASESRLGKNWLFGAPARDGKVRRRPTALVGLSSVVPCAPLPGFCDTKAFKTGRAVAGVLDVGIKLVVAVIYGYPSSYVLHRERTDGLLDAILTFMPENLPCLVMGDMNHTLDQLSAHELRAAPWSDLQTLTQKVSGTQILPTYCGTGSETRIDHVLLNQAACTLLQSGWVSPKWGGGTLQFRDDLCKAISIRSPTKLSNERQSHRE
eukprot:6480803-Amphidinium_carterae.1